MADDVVARFRADLDKFKKDIKGLKGELKKTQGSVDKSAEKMESSVSKSMSRIKQSIGAAFAIGSVVAFGRSVFRTIEEFEQSIADLGAITGATGDQLEGFKDEVLQVSANTGKGASDIAKAFQLVGSAQPELLKSSAALGAVTEQSVILSQAGGVEVPAAAEALTKAMNQFGASAEDAAKFTDILATAQQKGTAPIASVSEALRNAGAVANDAGLSFETTTAAIEALAKGGIEGAEAGTGLRSTLTKLQKAGIGFVDGQFDLQAALEETQTRLNDIQDPVKRTQEAQRLFGEENLKTVNTLIAQKDVLKELDGNLNETGNALEQANQRMDTFSGASEKANSAWERFVLSFEDGEGAISQAATGVVNSITDILNKLTEINDSDNLNFFEQFLALTSPMSEAIADSTLSTEKLGNKFQELSNKKEVARFIVDVNKRLDELHDEYGRGLINTEEYNRQLVDLQLLLDGSGRLYQTFSENQSKSIELSGDSADAQEEDTKATDKNTESKKRNTEVWRAQRFEFEQTREELDRLVETALDFSVKDPLAEGFDTSKLTDVVGDIGDIAEAEFEETTNVGRAADEIATKAIKRQNELKKVTEALTISFGSLGEVIGNIINQGGAEQMLGSVEGILAIKQAYDQVVDTVTQFGQRLNNIQQLEADTQKTIELNNLRRQEQAALAGLEGEARIEAQEKFDEKRQEIEKRAFEREKKLAIRQAQIDRASAVLKALSKGAVLGGVEIILIEKEFAAQIENIKAQEFQGFKKGVLDLRGGIKGKDSIPAMLAPRESVMTAEETQEHYDALRSMKEGKFEKYIYENYQLPAIEQAKSTAERISDSVKFNFDNRKLEKEGKNHTELLLGIYHNTKRRTHREVKGWQ